MPEGDLRPRSSWPSALSWIGLLAALLASCTSTLDLQADRQYEAGHLLAAAEGFRAYLESQPVDPEVASRALYRLGVIHATVDSPGYPAAEARALFERLLREYPGSVWATEAALLLAQQDRLEEERQLVKDGRIALAELELELEEWRQEVYALQKRRGEAEGELRQRELDVEALEAEVETLRTRVTARELEIEKLERLKEIDLESPPPRRRR